MALLALAGTLMGSYFANRKTTALIAYRLEQLEKKVAQHNRVVERTYHLEQETQLLDQRLRETGRRVKELESGR